MQRSEDDDRKYAVWQRSTETVLKALHAGQGVDRHELPRLFAEGLSPYHAAQALADPDRHLKDTKQ